MIGSAKVERGRPGNRLRVAGWSLAASLLLMPAAAMRFTNEVNWGPSDFVAAGVLIGGVGLLAELAVRTSARPSYRAAAALALSAAFLTVWINLAVGVIGPDDDPVNLLIGCVITAAAAGTFVARFRAEGMARAMAATAIVQAVIAAVSLLHDVRGFVLGGFFTVLWLASAWLFARAARAGG